MNRSQASAWQQSWDRQQEAFLPDREHRFDTMLDVVEAIAPDDDQRVTALDLAGGTGSITARLLRRFPGAQVTLLDLDPVLTHIAAASLPGSVTVVSADLRDPHWLDGLAGPFDAVLAATALHWLTPDRLAALYGEIATVLAGGGVFVNVDYMPDPDLPTLSKALHATDKRRREALYRAGAAISWSEWWSRVAADAELGPLKAHRDTLFSTEHAQEWLPDVSWHLAALGTAGFSEVGLVWRGGLDAAVAGRK